MEYNEEILKNVSDYAIDNFKHGLNCAESVYHALLKVGALDGVDPKTLSLMVGFGGGVGLSGCMCGALSAAVAANGAKYGRPDPYAIEPEEERMTQIARKLYSRYNNLIHDFTEQNGSPLCKEICGKYDKFEDKARKVGCLKMIGATAQLAYKYLQMTPEEAEVLPFKENLAGR